MEIDETQVQITEVPAWLQEATNELEQATIFNYASQDPFKSLIYQLKEDAKSRPFVAPAILLESPRKEQAKILPRAFALALNPTTDPFYHPKNDRYPKHKPNLVCC